jgi:hypothetical protein
MELSALSKSKQMANMDCFEGALFDTQTNRRNLRSTTSSTGRVCYPSAAPVCNSAQELL